MERRDRKKTVHREWEANYNAIGRSTVDESSTELTGSRREADLIVRGLKALKAQVELREAAGIATQDDKKWDDASLGEAPKLSEVEKLLEAVAKPSYAEEPVVEQRYS